MTLAGPSRTQERGRRPFMQEKEMLSGHGRSRASPNIRLLIQRLAPLAPLNAAAMSETVTRIPAAGPFDAARAGGRGVDLLDERRGAGVVELGRARQNSGMGRIDHEKERAARRDEQRGLEVQFHLANSHLLSGLPESKLPDACCGRSYYVTGCIASQVLTNATSEWSFQLP